MPKTPLKSDFSASAAPPLDFPGFGSMFRETFGKYNIQMRNIITKLLIVVVPRRTAGDG